MADTALNRLVERAAEGEQDAVRELLVAHLPSVEAYIRLRAGAMLRGKESCADLLQSFCLQALQSLDKFEFRSDAEFRCWLFQNALHKISNKARYYQAGKRDVAREVDGAGGGALSDETSVMECYASICTPSRHARGREALAAFEAAFADLPDDYQEAITLHRIGGLGYDEIAERMDRSVGAARNLVYRGLARLSMQLGR